jgi:hypothetical protein
VRRELLAGSTVIRGLHVYKTIRPRLTATVTTFAPPSPTLGPGSVRLGARHDLENHRNQLPGGMLLSMKPRARASSECFVFLADDSSKYLRR